MVGHKTDKLKLMGYFFIYPDKLDKLRQAGLAESTQISVIMYIIDHLDEQILTRHKVATVTSIKLSQGDTYSYPCIGVQFMYDRSETDLNYIEDYVEGKANRLLHNVRLLDIVEFMNNNQSRIKALAKLYYSQSNDS